MGDKGRAWCIAATGVCSEYIAVGFGSGAQLVRLDSDEDPDGNIDEEECLVDQRGRSAILGKDIVWGA